MQRSRYHFWAKIAVVLAFIVILLGAYTRLEDAGLGCPDWPGCYGKMVLPDNAIGLTHAQQAFPAIPIQPEKAWREMVHRYCAGALGVLVLVLAIWGIVRRKKDPRQPFILPWVIVVFIGLQAAFGMWTVTLKLLPIVVTTHLLGGMLLISLLCWLALSTTARKTLPGLWMDETALHPLRPWAILALVIVGLQIFLGAWTSTNYAAIACSTFPGCNGSIFPHMEWARAFNFFRPIGPNYDHGVLDDIARVTIQMAHRYGAFVTAVYLIGLVLTIWRKPKFKGLHKLGLLIVLLLIVQITLGILNVVLKLPLDTAVAHNAVAALLLLSIVTLVYRTFQR